MRMDAKRIIGQSVFIIMITCGISFASTYDLGVNAGHSTLEARFNTTLALERGLLTTGIGAIYSDDGYRMANVKLSVGNGVSLPQLEFGLGFKGVVGHTEKDDNEGDLMAIGFLFLGRYFIPESLLPIPISVALDFSWAPGSLCFLDSESYLEVKTNLEFRIVKNAAIILGYRHLRVHLDDGTKDWEMSDGTFVAGYELWF